jgi:hypothetical protein
VNKTKNANWPIQHDVKPGHCQMCIEHLCADRAERFVTEWLWGLHTVWLGCWRSHIAGKGGTSRNSEVLQELQGDGWTEMTASG